MKKAIVLLILLAACKRTETTNETTTTMTVTESSATVATVAPTATTPPTATAAIQTMGTNPTVKRQPPDLRASPLNDSQIHDLRDPSASIGAGVYRGKGCGVCHGVRGAGDTPMGKSKNIRDFRSATVQNRSDADLVENILLHKGEPLTEDQAKAVVAWIRTLK